MTRFAVSLLNFFDKEIVTKVVSASSVKDALAKHSWLNSEDTLRSWLKGIPDDLEGIKEEFFNIGMAVDVIEIKDA